ncbi:MAG: MFS transporter, partial [Actinomycetaceae bacterium]|nr:MFS transporter [Actinomycetaceae bacterium]
LGCGLSQNFDSFEILLLARVVQAIGGGGILPVATAEFGTAFPPEKRGLALGFVGMAFGVANIVGSSVGSAIMDIFGTHHWPYVFYINIPICVFIIIAGIFFLPSSHKKSSEPLDMFGIIVLTFMILGLMYALKNIDFTDFHSLVSIQVYPYLLASLLLTPLFVWREKRADDPVMSLQYFVNRDILLTLMISVVTGIILMGTVFVPQFAENALGMEEGSGGYLVMILALFSGIGSPVSGKLIDAFGVKPVLSIGLLGSAAGGAYAGFIAAYHPTWAHVIVSLVLLGCGLGFTMGTPLNYMMLIKTQEKEANSALATLSLVRSLGTTIGPSIMVAFISVAGAHIPDKLTGAAPYEYENIVRTSLNEGFAHMFQFVMLISVVAFVLLVFYQDVGQKKDEINN